MKGRTTGSAGLTVSLEELLPEELFPEELLPEEELPEELSEVLRTGMVEMPEVSSPRFKMVSWAELGALQPSPRVSVPSDAFPP